MNNKALLYTIRSSKFSFLHFVLLQSYIIFEDGSQDSMRAAKSNSLRPSRVNEKGY